MAILSGENLMAHQHQLVAECAPILRDRRVLALVAETRVGKSRVAAELAKEYGGFLVLTKKAALGDWERELRQVAPGVPVMLLNYQRAHYIGRPPFTAEYHTVILDESHAYLSAFPKPSKTAATVRRMVGQRRVIMLTGTPSVESLAKLYFQFAMSAWGPWSGYTSFYKWHKDYGRPYQIRGPGGQMITQYDKVAEKAVMDDIESYVVTMTKKEADPDFIEPEIEPVYIRMPESVRAIYDSMDRKNLAKVEGIEVVAESEAAKLQKLQQIAGGTIIVGKGDRRELHAFKANIVDQLFCTKRRVAIFYNFVAEREMLLRLPKSTDDIELFRGGGYRYFIGQIKRFSEGVDLSMCTCAVVYSANWSGTTFIQAANRICNKRRRIPATVHVMITVDTVDEAVYAALSRKEDFNTAFYRRHAESKIQAAIIKHLNECADVWVVKVVGSNKIGCPDIIVCFRGHFVAFEVKRASGKLTDMQRYQINRISHAGGAAHAVRSVDEVVGILAGMVDVD